MRVDFSSSSKLTPQTRFFYGAAFSVMAGSEKIFVGDFVCRRGFFYISVRFLESEVCCHEVL